jgi:murein hydrolase activator
MGMIRTQILFLFLLLLSVSNVWADLQDSRSQLKKIQQRIENAQTDLKEKRKSELQFSRELALLKRTLQQLDEHISKLKKEQRQLQNQVGTQKQQLESRKQNIRRTGKRLEKRLVALYKEGEVGPLKILFSADSPTELVQQYHYLTRVLGHDRELLDEYRVAVESQQQGLAALEQLNSQKAALLDKEQQQRKVAANGRSLQTRLLKRVKKEQSKLKQELVQLKDQAKRLQALVSRLRKESVSTPALPPGAVSFSVGKGTLSWPVNGKVLIGFGTKKDKTLGTYYESNGIEISAVPGTSIRAVAGGKVVFADWFKGYGNLLIVNHPGGFHTLYAQLDKFGKSLGEQIRAGDVLGKSGLGGRDSIYFEIRQNGSPVNPLKWLRRR